MFLGNKYARWYFSLIEQRRTFIPTGPTERHHIIPKSLGGSNEAANLVRLTLREHFICHLLLARMTEGMDRARMQLAVVRFRKEIRTSRQYELARRYRSEALSALMKGKKKTDEHRQKMSDAAKNLAPEVRQRVSDSQRVKSLETRERMKQAALARDPAHNQKIGLAHKGIPKPDEAKRKVSEAVKNLPKLTCPHCAKTGSPSNMARWHFGNCRQKIS